MYEIFVVIMFIFPLKVTILSQVKSYSGVFFISSIHCIYSTHMHIYMYMYMYITSIHVHVHNACKVYMYYVVGSVF